MYSKLIPLQISIYCWS